MGMPNMPSAMAAHILMLALLTATSALPMQRGAAQQLAEAEAAIDHMLADDALARRARAEFMHMHEHGGGGGGGGGGAAAAASSSSLSSLSSWSSPSLSPSPSSS